MLVEATKTGKYKKRRDYADEQRNLHSSSGFNFEMYIGAFDSKYVSPATDSMQLSTLLPL